MRAALTGTSGHMPCPQRELALCRDGEGGLSRAIHCTHDESRTGSEQSTACANVRLGVSEIQCHRCMSCSAAACTGLAAGVDACMRAFHVSVCCLSWVLPAGRTAARCGGVNERCSANLLCHRVHSVFLSSLRFRFGNNNALVDDASSDTS
jgi:hypothetical protein